jgi:hypothetical protein
LALEESAPQLGPLEFSPEAGAEKELWCHYHAAPRANADASIYDIREHF